MTAFIATTLIAASVALCATEIAHREHMITTSVCVPVSDGTVRLYRCSTGVEFWK